MNHLYDDHGPVLRTIRKATRDWARQVSIRGHIDPLQTRQTLRRLRVERPDIVVVLKGDTFDLQFWQELNTYPRSVLWLYDELRRTHHTRDSLSSARAIASYSASDTADLAAGGYATAHIELAFDRTAVVNPHYTNEVSFIGARIPRRDTVLRAMDACGIHIRTYGRDWSDHIVDRARTLRRTRIGLPNSRDVSRQEAYDIMAGSIATLNIHGDQDGFTMRTFEAAGAGAVQLIDRPDVADLYEPDKEIAVFTSPQEAAELARRAKRDAAWANRIREGGRRRTLAEHTFDHRVAALEQLWQ